MIHGTIPGITHGTLRITPDGMATTLSGTVITTDSTTAITRRTIIMISIPKAPYTMDSGGELTATVQLPWAEWD